MEVLYLKSQRLQHQEIRHLCCISKATLTNYLKQYQEGGIEAALKSEFLKMPIL